MKPFRKILAGLVLAIVATMLVIVTPPAVVEAAGPYFSSLYASIKIINSGYQTIADSLRVGNTATFNGAVTMNSSLTAGLVVADTNAFALDAATDTVAVTGAQPTDLYFVSIIGAAAADSVSAIVIQRTATGFVLHRTAATVEGAQKYTWLRIKKP
jgi:hypothetical protein